MESTQQGTSDALKDTDRAHPAVANYLAVRERIEELRRLVREAESGLIDAAADLPTEGPYRGCVGRIAEHLGEKESRIESQKKRGRKARREREETAA